mmetsp:Transcript_23411/g.50957  ORF Transcript_23411/g.50957 Transcript_23411/m.50957 type:complete len:108 (+) Transcript_23411:432-755(+)
MCRASHRSLASVRRLLLVPLVAAVLRSAWAAAWVPLTAMMRTAATRVVVMMAAAANKQFALTRDFCNSAGLGVPRHIGSWIIHWIYSNPEKVSRISCLESVIANFMT